MRLPLLCLALLAALPARADTLPPEVRAVLEEAEGSCGGAVTLGDRAVNHVDLNGDGSPDWLIDTGEISCPGSTTVFCGTAGCGVTTIIDGARGELLLHDWDTASDGIMTYLTAPNDRGETVRFYWTGLEWVLMD